VETGSRDDIEQRALPFREGEELLVTIEEPHMYNEDDAVAKIDGYVISVSGAGRLLGEQRLVRIGEVRRTSASAEIIGGQDGQPAPAEPQTSSDGGSRRRRGRRGGRGRRRQATQGAQE
jgi:ribonuclease G